MKVIELEEIINNAIGYIYWVKMHNKKLDSNVLLKILGEKNGNKTI